MKISRLFGGFSLTVRSGKRDDTVHFPMEDAELVRDLAAAQSPLRLHTRRKLAAKAGPAEENDGLGRARQRALRTWAEAVCRDRREAGRPGTVVADCTTSEAATSRALVPAVAVSSESLTPVAEPLPTVASKQRPHWFLAASSVRTRASWTLWVSGFSQ